MSQLAVPHIYIYIRYITYAQVGCGACFLQRKTRGWPDVAAGLRWQHCIRVLLFSSFGKRLGLLHGSVHDCVRLFLYNVLLLFTVLFVVSSIVLHNSIPSSPNEDIFWWKKHKPLHSRGCFDGFPAWDYRVWPFRVLQGLLKSRRGRRKNKGVSVVYQFMIV